MRDITLTSHADQWFTETPARFTPLRTFDAVIMRKDPPFDAEYIYATHLLGQAEREARRSSTSPPRCATIPRSLR